MRKTDVLFIDNSVRCLKRHYGDCKRLRFTSCMGIYLFLNVVVFFLVVGLPFSDGYDTYYYSPFVTI
jgi:hypothetical protein